MHNPLNGSERVLALLSDCNHLIASNVHPREKTQQGIAEELGLSRPHVAKELKKLMDKGYVNVTAMARVAGMSRKMRVYNITVAGLGLLEAIGNGGVRKTPGDGGNGGDGSNGGWLGSLDDIASKPGFGGN